MSHTRRGVSLARLIRALVSAPLSPQQQAERVQRGWQKKGLMGQVTSAAPQPKGELVEAGLVNLSKQAIESLWTSYNLTGGAFALTLADVVTILENADSAALGDVECAVSIAGRAELLFSVFDTDRNGLVDAFELFVTLGLLSGMDSIDKLYFAFSVYDFDSRGALSLEETALLLRSCASGQSSLLLSVPVLLFKWGLTSIRIAMPHITFILSLVPHSSPPRLPPSVSDSTTQPTLNTSMHQRRLQFKPHTTTFIAFHFLTPTPTPTRTSTQP